MKRKPTSYGDMLKTVGAVRHPLLKPHHREILFKIAIFANENGKGSRPTYAYLRAGTNHTDEYIRQLLNDLRGAEFNLVERTHTGQGKGNASIFRIRLENPAFPDDYPTHTVTPTDDKKLTPTDDEVAPTGQAVNPNSQEGLPQLPSDFTPTTELGPSLPAPPPAPPPPSLAETRKNSATHKSTAPIVAMPSGWGSSGFLAAMGEPTPAQCKQLGALARPYGVHGWVLLEEVVYKWTERPKGIDNLREPWFFFLKECPSRRVKEIILDNPRLAMKGIPGYKEKFDLGMDQQSLTHRVHWSCFALNTQPLSDIERELLNRAVNAHANRLTREEINTARAILERIDEQERLERLKPTTLFGDSEEGPQ